MTTVSSVSPAQPQAVIYDLDDLFASAVADQEKRAADLEKYGDTAYGNSRCSALLNSATKVVDALQAFKDTGATQVQTQYAIPENERVNSNPNARLGTQIARGQVKPIF